ncbi:MAG: hypothetical protein HYR72_22875 [Deltaproteobacteria bacterium]|nr:hypothetical protein [Deltaproteobacteria bacterium]MBI3390692.1 hypothetical protein [Deltaproteobacteria bacterium]
MRRERKTPVVTVASLLLWSVLGAAAAPAAKQPIQSARRAVDDATVAIFAFRDQRGRPMAWPVTPYRDGDTIAITSTLAYIQKAVHVRRDGRVALLASGVLITGDATVHADISGDEFVTRFLDQELRKYPPARDLVRIPLHRWLFSWYFGRVFMEFTPRNWHDVPGNNHATLITLDADGFPSITPIAAPDPQPEVIEVHALATAALVGAADGPSTVLLHDEPTPTDLRQLILRGDLHHGVFTVRSREGSLMAPPEIGWLGALEQQIDYHQRARRTRALIRGWETKNRGVATSEGQPHR